MFALERNVGTHIHKCTHCGILTWQLVWKPVYVGIVLSLGLLVGGWCTHLLQSLREREGEGGEEGGEQWGRGKGREGQGNYYTKLIYKACMIQRLLYTQMNNVLPGTLSRNQ